MRSLLITLSITLFTFAASAQNPFLPLWEYIPDGEPYVFEDPDKPGEYRVYVYGSHDSSIDKYCGLEQVVWSASVKDLNNWRYDGVILKVTRDAKGNLLHEDGRGDMLYAPDVTMREENGKKVYYLYPNNQEGGRQGMVAKSDRPDGPFEVINWNPQNPRETIGDLRFDPGVFVDNDGKVYAYWGFEQSFGAELDPVTMATIKPETLVTDMIPHYKQDGVFRFFEASSMRKIKDKYVFIYSRWTEPGEFGLPTTNYTLAYAYSDNPLGPFTYGGTIIDGRGRDKDVNTGKDIVTATASGNTHGSIFEVDGQWYVVYHRQTGLDEYSRQAMVAPITVKVQKGKGGKVTISEGEYTSEGFNIKGLNPLNKLAAGTACYYVGSTPASNDYPHFIHSGSYMRPTRLSLNELSAPFNLKECYTPVVNNTSGSIVGWKYFNFESIGKKDNASLRLHLIPQGVQGKVKVMLGSPYESRGGWEIGRFEIKKNAPQQMTEIDVPVHDLHAHKGKQALFLLFESETKGESICELYDLQFVNS